MLQNNGKYLSQPFSMLTLMTKADLASGQLEISVVIKFKISQIRTIKFLFLSCPQIRSCEHALRQEAKFFCFYYNFCSFNLTSKHLIALSEEIDNHQYFNDPVHVVSLSLNASLNSDHLMLKYPLSDPSMDVCTLSFW